ncbi:MAG: FN3 associated domain-containing protein [Bacteroidales bacterium]
MFLSAIKLEVKTPYPDLVIRYETGQEKPTLSSTVYTRPFELEKTTQIQVAAFRGDAMSSVERAEFVKIKSANSFSITPEPSPLYSGAGAITLFDRKEGPLDFKDKAWLGFEGESVSISLTLNNPDLKKVVVSCLHVPSSWIFSPEAILIEGSKDGDHWKNVGQWKQELDYESLQNGKYKIEVPLMISDIKYLRINIKSIGNCTAGHTGAGKPAWLFLDEVWVECILSKISNS